MPAQGEGRSEGGESVSARGTVSLRCPEAAADAGRLPPAGRTSGIVELWSAVLDDQPADVVAHLQTLISPDEAERARKFYFERDRRRFVVGRGILRTLLGRYLDRA